MRDFIATKWSSDKLDGYVIMAEGGFVAIAYIETSPMDEDPEKVLTGDGWDYGAIGERFGYGSIKGAVVPTFKEAAKRLENYRLHND